ncbi:MAG: glycerol-3-phosphate 1-O-acyltransferase PlsY [Chloroflexi bacterium]|nr:glycerol-3-phosphate 1-O-acyltransferase PlsY [Chloroflexota bacterium]
MTPAEVGLVALAVLVGYVLGSVPSGVIVGRLWGGVDVRKHGSGRMGATNVLRTLGLKAAVLVTVLDVGKGALAMAMGGLLGDTYGNVAAGVAVVAGHNWPFTVGFRGGRGVMPAVGAALVAVPIAGAVGISLAAIFIIIFRYVSLGSLAGTISCCAIIMVLAIRGSEPAAFAPMAIAGGGLIVFQHRDNILRLVRGTERRLGQRA